MQQQIADKAGQIREFANHAGQQMMFDPITSDTGVLEQWVAVCLALDTLQDATDALVYCQESDVGNDVRERHIRIYGMFQAVVLQQQAICKLYEVFVGEKLSAPKDSRWRKITDVYHRAVAAPLEVWDPSHQRGQLSQITITSEGYYIVLWDCHMWGERMEEIEPERIDPDVLLGDYTLEAIICLDKICQAIDVMGS